MCSFCCLSDFFVFIYREFDDKIWELNSSSRLARLNSTVGEVVPLVTSRSSELFYWGGGKQTPQRLEGFSKGRSALQVSLGGAHYAVVTVEKEVYTWTVSQGCKHLLQFTYLKVVLYPTASSQSCPHF